MNLKEVIKFNYKQIFKTPILFVIILFLVIGISQTVVNFAPKVVNICVDSNINVSKIVPKDNKNVKILENVKNKDECDQEIHINFNSTDKVVKIKSNSEELIQKFKNLIQVQYNLQFVPKNEQLKFEINKDEGKNNLSTFVALGIIFLTSMILGQLMYMVVAGEKINKISLMTQYFIEPIKLILIKLFCFISILLAAIIAYIVLILILLNFNVIVFPKELINVLTISNVILFLIIFVVTAIINTLVFVGFASKVDSLDKLPVYSFLPAMLITMIFMTSIACIQFNIAINQLVYIPLLTMILLPVKISNYGINIYEILGVSITNGLMLYTEYKLVNKIFKKR